MEDETRVVQPQETQTSQTQANVIGESERLPLDHLPTGSYRERRGMSKVVKIVAVSAALLLVVVALLLSRGISFFSFGRAPSNSSTNAASANISLVAGSVEKFNYLSQQTSSSCSLQPETVLTYADEARLQGSCCSPMDLARYQAQVEGLESYSDIPQIPGDPYDVPAALARELLGYQRDIQLTVQQQAIYDQAMSLSEEGGPCCCRCWRWYAFEGMAKYLITQRNWNAQQIAELWGLVDGCGGPGHQHG